MSTIKDVAKLANVSISTVSYAINDSGNVSKETKKKILKAAKELGYKPSGIARSLKTKKTEIIGVFVNELAGPIYTEILRGIQEVALSNDYEVIVGDCFSSNNTITRLLSERIVDGAVILAPAIPDKKLISISQSNLPIVVLDREAKDEAFSSILIDNESASYNVVKFFNELGYKDVGFISGPEGSYDSIKRFAGFSRGIKDFKLNFDEKWHGIGNFTEKSGYDIMKKFIEEVELPRAFFIANDEMAIGAIMALKEANINIPERVAIVGFDDIKLAEYITPTLTTVRRPSYDLGVLAAHTLFNNLKGNTRSKTMMLSTELIVRESCK